MEHRLARLAAATDALQALPSLDHVLSLTNVDDFTPDPMGGISTGKTYADFMTVAKQPTNMQVALDVKGREFVELFIERMERLAYQFNEEIASGKEQERPRNDINA